MTKQETRKILFEIGDLVNKALDDVQASPEISYALIQMGCAIAFSAKGNEEGCSIVIEMVESIYAYSKEKSKEGGKP